MTASRSGPVELAREVGARARELAGMLRRMVVTRTRSALWQVTGHLLLDGQRETRDAEVFQGVGFASRPNETDDTEAIVAFPGGPAGPIVIAARQEARKRVVAADLAAGETQIHNSVIGANATIIRIKTDGTVEIKRHGGNARRLAFLDELEALRDWVDRHTHPNSGGPPDPPAPPTPTGTEVLKGE